MDGQTAGSPPDGPRDGRPDRGGPVPPGPNPPVFGVPATAMRRFGATVLDPSTAERSGEDRPRPRPVAYVPDRLFVPGLPGGSFEDSRSLLERIGREMGFSVRVVDGGFGAVAEQLEVFDRLDAVAHTPVDLVPDTTAARPAIDAWTVVARARAEAGEDAVRGWSLNHVLMSAGGYWGGVGGYWGGVGGYWGGVGGYWGGVNAPGTAVGRGPLVLALDAPAPTATHHPCVAVLDTGLGAHPWFDGSPLVTPDPTVAGQRVGLNFPPDEDPENTGVTIDRLNGMLDPMAGHGTFVSGVVRQHSPDAHLVAVPVMYGDGAADERDVLEALKRLAAWHLAERGAKRRGVEVVNLSLGYYHEDVDPDVTSAAVLSLLHALAADGVAVVAAAGNGATTEEFWPAALSRHTADGAVPVTSVGALDHCGTDVATFSNTGPWVTDYRRGMAVVSTMPTTLNGSVNAAVHSRPPHDPARDSGDPERYACGFGVWSGTSFAAPAAAGLVAAALADVDLPHEGPERAKVVAEVVAKALGGRP